MPAFFLLVVVAWFGLLSWIHKKAKGHRKIGGSMILDQAIHAVIPFRNEADRIVECLQALNASEGLHQKIHIWLVDDHSTDETAARIDELRNKLDQLIIEVLPSYGEGKKRALLTALDQLSEGWVYLTDADCRVRRSTIRSMLLCAARSEASVVFGPVLYEERKGKVWDRLLAYENLNTQVVSEAFVRIGKPVMVNGGNLLLHASMVPRYRESLHLEYTSGDDVFFAQQLSQHEMTGAYDRAAVVCTDAPNEIGPLLAQRIRWASKYPGYRFGVQQLLPAIVFGFNLVFLVLFLSLFTLPSLLHPLTLIWILKWAVEFSFHSLWFRKYAFRVGIFESLVMSTIYPLYYVVVGVLALIGKRFTWKGRVYSR